MKRILLSMSLLIILGSVSSCKKDWTCECTDTEVSPSGTTTSKITFTINDKKKDAEESCDGLEFSISSGSYTDSRSCEIK